MPTPTVLSQSTTISASTSETTIVTADAGSPNLLVGLVVTTNNAAAGTLTLRESTAGATRSILDYPNAAAAPGAPLVVTFPTPLYQPTNSNWTLQASVNAGAYHITALYTKL